MMTSNEDLSINALPPSDFHDQEPRDTEHDLFHLNLVNSRQQESKMKRGFVLAGSAILQLPIWGRFSPTG